ncbi:MAG: response regulator [Alphaproteobacteria bacterium]
MELATWAGPGGMIIERRVVIFPIPDLLDAMRDHGEKIGRRLPAMAPESLVFDPGVDDALVVRFPARGISVPVPALGISAPVQEVVFNREEVAASLIRYCRKQRVPIPRAGSKKLERHRDGGAALLIQNQPLSARAMIIDDQEVMRSIVRRLLLKIGLTEVFEATGGENAFEMLRKGAEIDPDIFICDLHMEKMDGIEFVRRLRADKTSHHHRKPVLILTADKETAHRDKAMRAGASQVLAKPIAAEELGREISFALGYVDAGPDAAPDFLKS